MPPASVPARLREHVVTHHAHHDEDIPLRRVYDTLDVLCAGAMFHSPRPLYLVVTTLVSVDWTGHYIEGATEVPLCGTCQDNLTVYQSLLLEYDGEVPWYLRREFGNMIRSLGDQGWAEYRRLRDG